VPASSPGEERPGYRAPDRPLFPNPGSISLVAVFFVAIAEVGRNSGRIKAGQEAIGEFVA
jgi:hypothetical protein